MLILLLLLWLKSHLRETNKKKLRNRNKQLYYKIKHSYTNKKFQIKEIDTKKDDKNKKW